MSGSGKPRPSYAPVYAAAMYPGLCEVFRRHGYALAVHGSLARDLDLVAVPWTEGASEEAEVMEDVMGEYAVTAVGLPEAKPHGRRAYSLSVGFGECAVDLSFMPLARRAE